MTTQTPEQAAENPQNGDNSVHSPIRTWDKGVFLASKFTCTGEEFSELIKASKWEHYVYGLCLDNGAVFYVGKGVGTRALEHAKEAYRGDDSEKCQYIRAIGPRLRYTIFLQCSDSDYALGFEAYLIHGHHDVLTNIAPASEAAFQRMFQPLDPIRRELDALEYVGRYLDRANTECRESMKALISKCPAIEGTLSPEELEWMNEGCAHE